MFAPKNILIPTNFTENAEKALRTALAIALKFGSELRLLHVGREIQQCTGDYCMDTAKFHQAEQDNISASWEALNRLVNKITDRNGVKIVTEVKAGSQYEEIIREQQDEKIDLIIIEGNPKKGLIAHLMNGLAEKVSRGAMCPVIVVN
jgi:nucleotide-binding universal stress UspA family protein